MVFPGLEIKSHWRLIMAKKSKGIGFLGILLLAGSLLAGCGDSGTGDPSSSQGDGNPGYIALLNQADSSITEVRVIYEEGDPKNYSFPAPSPWNKSTTAVRNQAARNGAFRLQVKNSTGGDITSSKIFTVTKDHIYGNPLPLTYTGTSVLEGFLILQ
jgi:hypothetical protein